MATRGRVTTLHARHRIFEHRIGCRIVHRGDQVVHVGLMHEHHQRHDVALGRQIRRGIELAREIRARALGGHVDLRAIALLVGDLVRELGRIHVAGVRSRARRAGHIPSAEALSQRRGVGRAAVMHTHDRVTVPVGDRRNHHEARHAARGRAGLVAHETGGRLAREHWTGARLLTQRVENGTAHWIDGGDLEERAFLHVADVHVVVEVDRAGRPRRDLVRLQTGA